MVWLDQSLVGEPVECAVESAGPQRQPPAGEGSDVADDAIAVHGLPREGGEDQEGGFLQRLGCSHSRNISAVELCRRQSGEKVVHRRRVDRGHWIGTDR
ncbi:hypothetical protein ABGB16_29620 [Micromonospora sp. B11E3]|uniref:hypothetical protein n=1 Tax=Micromonospora sp. B11E3 TaxID=3153562 RepID=UPI00325DEC8E